MGIFSYLDISESVTKEEWKDVYEETLKLVDAFPLAEQRAVSILDIDVVCLAPTIEREEIFVHLRAADKVSVGWTACGDYTWLMSRAEDFYLKRDLVEEKRFNENAGDAMLANVPSVTSRQWTEKQFNNVYRVWDSKTQGRLYHIYILAIACMIESRLGEKAFVDGNITYGQCQRAVELANEHLEKPIDLPDRCVAERFIKRVKKLPLNEAEQYTMFESLYLGDQDANFVKCLKQGFSKDILGTDWEDDAESTVEEYPENEVQLDTEEGMGQENTKYETKEKESERYDIDMTRELRFYIPGDKMPEDFKAYIGKFFNLYNRLLEEDNFKSLMKEEPKERCRWLAKENRTMLLREEDWRSIFADILANEDSFSRYYPMVRMKIKTDEDYDMIVAFVLNKDLYDYCIELGEKYKE